MNFYEHVTLTVYKTDIQIYDNNVTLCKKVDIMKKALHT